MALVRAVFVFPPWAAICAFDSPEFRLESTWPRVGVAQSCKEKVANYITDLYPIYPVLVVSSNPESSELLDWTHRFTSRSVKSLPDTGKPQPTSPTGFAE